MIWLRGGPRARVIVASSVSSAGRRLRDVERRRLSCCAGITNASPSTPQELHQQAGAVKEKAKSVDLFSHTANEHLNEAFKTTYEALSARH